MAVQRWRWWQWFLVSLLVGGLLGFVFTRTEVEETAVATRDLRFFIDHLRLETAPGSKESIVDGIRVSPPVVDVRGRSIENVTFWLRAKNTQTGNFDRVQQYQVRVNRPLFAKTAPVNYDSIHDYLVEQQKTFPNLDYAYNFWQQPKWIWILSLGGSVLVIGILWPILIRVLVKLGLGLPETDEERGIDLSKVSSRGSTLAVPTGPVVTEEDRDQLEALNEQLESNVGGMLIQDDQPDEEEERRAEAAVVRQLSGQAVESQEVAPADHDESREYGGEFYPVARPVVKKKDEE